MYRVILASFLALTVAACSVGTKSLSLNLNDQPATAIDPNFVSGESKLGDGAQQEARASASALPNLAPPGPAPTKVAMRADLAPQSSVTKAPKGALSDRSYQKTNLDAAAARQMINAYRKQNGLPPLALSDQLAAAAHAHSLDLAKWDRISHYGSDGSNPWDRVRRAGYEARLAAENVGTGQASLQEVFAGWKKSPGHNKNLLLKDAKEMGIALVYDAKTEFKTFWTLVLGTRS